MIPAAATAVRLLLPVLLPLGISSAAPLASAADEAGISFVHSAPSRPGESIRFRFDRGQGWRQATARSRYPNDRYDYRLHPGEEVRAEAVLLRGGKAVATTSIAIPVEGDRRYIVHAAVQPDDPTAMCMGCIGATSAPIAGESGDGARRLWLYWSFNGISHPILF